MIATAILIALVAGAIAGNLLTRRVGRHEIQQSRRLGLIEGRQEQSRRVAFLQARAEHLQAQVARLEASARRVAGCTGDL